jgi:hypothetical protein
VLAIEVLRKVSLTLERAIAIWVRAWKINHGCWRIVENAEERRVEIENEVELMGSSTNFVESSGALGSKQTDGRPNQQLLPKKNRPTIQQPNNQQPAFHSTLSPTMSPSLRRTSNRGKKIADATTPASNDNQKVVAKASTGKRVREAEETVIELERAPAKKAKVPTTDTQPGPRRSGRSPKPNGKGVIEKRKRRTKAEVQAAKAAAEEAKKKKEEERKEAMRRLEQMDVDDIEDRAQTAAKMIRRLSDVESNDGSDGGEEFVGFNEVASSSSNESEVDRIERMRYAIDCVCVVVFESTTANVDLTGGFLGAIVGWTSVPIREKTRCVGNIFC